MDTDRRRYLGVILQIVVVQPGDPPEVIHEAVGFPICWEQADQPGEHTVFDLSLAPGTFESEFNADLLGGVTVLRHPGLASARPFASGPLYAPASSRPPEGGTPLTLTFIPYYAWANRDPQAMEVWVPHTTPAQAN